MVGSNVRPGTPAFDQLVEAVIWQESRGNPRAVSGAGAAGLMQVMPDTARAPGFGVRPLDGNRRFDAQENRRFGEEYLGAMLNRYDGNVERALAAYNWGAGNADRWNGNRANLPAETQGYLRNILSGARGPGGGRVAGQGSQPATPRLDVAEGPSSSNGQVAQLRGPQDMNPRRAAFEANMQSLANARHNAANTPFSQPGLRIGDSGQSRAATAQVISGVQLARLFE